jgi:hypothetical protein
MNMERLPTQRSGHHRYARMPQLEDRGPEPEPEVDGEAGPAPERRPEVLAATASASFRVPDTARVFDALPRASIIAVSRPDAGDITPMLLSYTIEVHYKQVSGSSCLPLSCSHSSARDASRFRWIDWWRVRPGNQQNLENLGEIRC